MKLVDANLLIYAINADSPQHAKSRQWLENALSGNETIGFAWVVLLAFLRVTTRSAILERPLSHDKAIAYVDSWLALPVVELVVPGQNHWSILRALMTASGTAGNLTSDAHLAALAVENGATLISTDNDFRRFSGLSTENPLSD